MSLSAEAGKIRSGDTMLRGTSNVRFQSGKSYIVTSHGNIEVLIQKCLSLLKDRRVLLVSRFPPHGDEGWGENVETISLSTIPSPDRYSPTALGLITKRITDHLQKNKNRGAVILTGMEYMYLHNPTDHLLRFPTLIKDATREYNGVFIVILDERAFSERERYLLAEGCEIIKDF